MNSKYVKSDRIFLMESSPLIYEYLLVDYFKEKNVYVEDYMNIMIGRIKEDMFDKAEKLYFISKTYEELLDDKDMILYATQIKDDETKEMARDRLKSLKNLMRYFLGNLIAMKTYYHKMNGEITQENINLYAIKLPDKEGFDSLNYIGGQLPTIDELPNILNNIISKLEDLKQSNNLT